VTGEIEYSKRPIAGFTPLATGRRIRVSRFVPPPELEPFGPEPLGAATVPNVGAGPPADPTARW